MKQRGEIKNLIKGAPFLKRMALFSMRLFAPFSISASLKAFLRYFSLFADWSNFKKKGGVAKILDFYPCLFDKSTTTSIDAHYFYQAIWAAKHIFARHAPEHIDIGSDVQFVGMLTTFTKVTFIDLRPLQLVLNNYNGREGSILDIPFPDDSLESLSSLHVVEHIGLGRYGDPIDPAGSEKACKELSRVLKPGGQLLVSVPIGRQRVQFNGQRVFDHDKFIAMFPSLTFKSMAIVDTHGQFKENISPAAVDLGTGAGLDYGLGMFLFTKTNESR